MNDVLIYLHGFNSSPQSYKAAVAKRFLQQFPGITLVQPQLAATPGECWQQLLTLVEHHQGARLGFVGSSLGGFFATVLKERFGGRALLINPAVKPQLLFDQFLGPQYQPYTHQHYYLGQQHVDELAALDWHHLACPEEYWVLLQQGDEVLNYQQAMAAYQGSLLTLEPLGDHSFIDFSRYLNAMVEFLFPVD